MLLLVTLSKDSAEIKKSFVEYLKGLLSPNADEACEAIPNVYLVLRGRDVENVIAAVNNKSILKRTGIEKNVGDGIQSKFYRDFFRLYTENTSMFPEISDEEEKPCVKIALLICQKYSFYLPLI